MILATKRLACKTTLLITKRSGHNSNVTIRNHPVFHGLQVAQTDLKRILDRDEWLDFIDECSHVANPKGKGRTQLASVTWERLVSAASGVALRDYEAQKRNAKRVCAKIVDKSISCVRAGCE